MPWKEAGPMLERMRFIEDYLSGLYSITELANGTALVERLCTSGLRGTTAMARKGLSTALELRCSPLSKRAMT
jgi:hypothetical protein